jgi:hypothetical protein
LARNQPNLVVSRSIFNVGMLRTPGGQGRAATGEPPAENLVSERWGAMGQRTQKSSNRLSDPDFSTGSTGVRLSGLMRLPEAAAVQEQIDAIIRPGIELGLGHRHTEAEGAALRQ